MKRLGFYVFSAALVVACSSIALAQPNISGNWTVEQTGYNGPSSSTVTITQTGNKLVGNNPTTGMSFVGQYCTPNVDKGCESALQMNGNWRDKSGGVGWLTVFVTPNGHSLNGTWGYNGRKANGSFVANKILPPVKITTAGNWMVTYAGGANLFAGPMTCTESGPSSLCKVSGITLDGKFRTSNKVRYKWTSKSQNGWFSFWFNDDGQSFNGQWGYGEDSSPVMGRVVGQRQGPPARM